MPAPLVVGIEIYFVELVDDEQVDTRQDFSQSPLSSNVDCR